MSLNSTDPPEYGEDPKMKVYGTVLLAFHYFGAEWMDLQSLINIMMASGCPNAPMAQKVLQNMTSESYLEWSRLDGKVCFRRTESGKLHTPPPPPGPIPRTAENN